MTRIISVFTIASGTASIIGLILQIYSEVKLVPTGVLTGIFVVGVILSIYVLFVPGSSIQENVRSKVEYFRREQVDVEKVGDMLVQRGTITLSGFNSRGIEFPVPFKNKPSVELLDPAGSDEMVEVVTVTPHHFVVRRPGGRVFGRFTYRWIARGEPLQPIKAGEERIS